ncbi:hypothetical protein [Paraferrimonas sedimenticola]|uniref:Uncharacterized protein n=1 Tax=Paraferrimonas sedimenticola TaxID=375674 RepID=A0AA37VXK2_9GAMM|nr:hypothetical protein [Paraferrimonas sedimenticola]GLP95290.1 hypothetical protein GCM10007895_05960 [Paraferrimonas sedimenticola]
MAITKKTSTAQLVKYAAETHGVDLKGQDRKDVIAFLEEQEPALFEATANPTAAPKAGKKQPSKVTLRVFSDNDEGLNYIQVIFNSVPYQIKKDEEVTVPYGVYDILRNAIQKRYKTVKDPVTQQNILKESKVQRWPFEPIAFID